MPNRPDAWHRLGIRTQGLSAESAMKRGHLLNWDLRKTALFTQFDDYRLPLSDSFALSRRHPVTGPEVLGVVGIGHTVVQNEEFIPFLDEFSRISGARFSTVGEMYGGRRIFVSMELPGRILIGGEAIKNYVVLLAGRDGQSSPALLVTPVHVPTGSVLNADPRARIGSFDNAPTDKEDVPRQAEMCLEYVFDYLDDFREKAERRHGLHMDQGRFDNLISAHFGARPNAPTITKTRAQNKLDRMSSLFARRPDTAWDGYLALAEWHDHYSPIRGTESGFSEEYLRARKAILDPGFKEVARTAML